MPEIEFSTFFPRTNFMQNTYDMNTIGLLFTLQPVRREINSARNEQYLLEFESSTIRPRTNF